MTANFNWACSGGGIQQGFLVAAETVAIHAKYSQLGRHQRWCNVSEDGAGSSGGLCDTCLDFKLKYRALGENNGLEEFRHANKKDLNVFN